MPNVWISGLVTLTVTNGRRHVKIDNLRSVKSPGLPKGPEVNAELSDPKSTLRREVEKVWKDGGEIEVGQMRVLNGGGAYSLPANKLDLTCEDGLHDALWGKVCQTFGGEPETATPVVFRGWGAPGTYAVFDGGGAGRGESIPTRPHEFLVTRCLGENFGEIGMLAHLPNGSEGRIDYSLGFSHKTHLVGAYERWLNDHVEEEWKRAHGTLPLIHRTACADLTTLPDSMQINAIRTDDVQNVKLAIEWHSASVECLTLSKLDIIGLETRTRLRFIDLESRGGKGLNRRIGIVLRRDDKLAVIAYKNGVFDHDFPMIPINEQTLAMIGNEKFETVLDMIRA